MSFLIFWDRSVNKHKTMKKFTWFFLITLFGALSCQPDWGEKPNYYNPDIPMPPSKWDKQEKGEGWCGVDDSDYRSSSYKPQNGIDGEKLFKQRCSACHTCYQRAIGPALKGSRDRVPDENWIYRWLENPQAMLDSGDVYALALFDEFNQAAHPSSSLTREEIDEILNYCECGLQ